jgi:hypothetical protein
LVADVNGDGASTTPIRSLFSPASNPAAARLIQCPNQRRLLCWESAHWQSHFTTAPDIEYYVGSSSREKSTHETL